MVGAGIGPGHYQRAAELTERYGVEVSPEQIFNGDLPYEVEVAIAAENGTTPPAPPAATGEFDEDALETRLEEINPDSDTWHWDSQFAASTPDAVIDALDAASDGNPHMDTFLETLRENPEMAQTLQRALAQEGGDLLGTIEDLARGTNSEFSLESLNAALETEGGRNVFTNALDLLAEDRIETRHFEGLMSKFDGADASEGAFIAALDPNKDQLEDIIDSRGSDASIAAVIADRTPAQFIEAVGSAYPEHAEIINIIGNDSELTEALHAVVVSDPSALTGFREILGAEGENAFTATDLQNILNNPLQRNVLTDVLERVAQDPNDEFTFDNVRRLMELSKDGSAESQIAIEQMLSDMGVTPSLGLDDFGEFFQDFMENPEQAITLLVNDLVAAGQIPPEMGNMIIGFAAPMGTLMQGMIEPYADLVERHPETFNLAALPERLENAGAELTEQYTGSTVDPHAESVDEAALAPEVVDTEVAALSPIRFEGPSGAPIPHSEAVLHAAADGMEAGALANGTYDLAALGITPDVTAAEAARVAAYDAETEALTVTRGATPSALTV